MGQLPSREISSVPNLLLKMQDPQGKSIGDKFHNREIIKNHCLLIWVKTHLSDQFQGSICHLHNCRPSFSILFCSRRMGKAASFRGQRNWFKSLITRRQSLRVWQTLYESTSQPWRLLFLTRSTALASDRPPTKYHTSQASCIRTTQFDWDCHPILGGKIRLTGTSLLSIFNTSNNRFDYTYTEVQVGGGLPFFYNSN